MPDNTNTSQNPVRWIYDWTLSWADTPHGQAALFLLAFTEATFFPVPPDVLLIALILGARSRSYRLAAVCTAGSLLGAVAGFGIGYFFWETTRSFFFRHIIDPATFEDVRALYDRNLFLIIFSAAFSPIPFKVFTLASGVFADGLAAAPLTGFFTVFFVASAVGRSIRFFLIAYLLHRYGEPVRSWLEKYFNLFTLVAILLLGLLVLLSRMF